MERVRQSAGIAILGGAVLVFLGLVLAPYLYVGWLVLFLGGLGIVYGGLVELMDSEVR